MPQQLSRDRSVLGRGRRVSSGGREALHHPCSAVLDFGRAASDLLSISAGIDLAFCLEPVIDLPVWGKAPLLCSAVGKVADSLVTFRRGQPVRDERQRPEEGSLSNGGPCGRKIRSGSRDGRYRNRRFRFIPWDPCACNFACHIALPTGPRRPAVTGFVSMSSTPEQQQWILAECAVGIV